MYITFEAFLPVLSGRERGRSNFIPSAGYIPGTTLRGWAAQEYLRQGRSPQDAAFQEMFLDECLSFPNLYPTIKPPPCAAGQWREPGPIPVTARTCKSYPGFTSEEGTHGVADRLFRSFLASLPGGVRTEERCQRCRPEREGGALDRMPGFCQRDATVSSYLHVLPKTRVLTRTAIDRDLGTTRAGMLYALEVLTEGTRFTGEVKTFSSQAADYARQLFSAGATVRVGGARTRGLGKLESIDTQKAHLQVDQTPLPDRLDGFNAALQTSARSRHAAMDGTYFSLTLRSDLLLMDPFLRYRLLVDEVVLQEPNLFEPGEIKAVWHACRHHRVQGWNDALGVPKGDEVAITMGSVFLFQYLSGDRASLLAKLQQIEDRGLGLRRGEGFGRLRACDPFHWEVQEL